MAEKKRMPPLRIDEVILLVDTYFQLREIESHALRLEMLSDLSSNMRSLPFNADICNDPAFRSPSGMDMLINNLRTNYDASKKPYGQLSAKRRKVYDYYLERRQELNEIAKCILSISNMSFPILSEYMNNVLQFAHSIYLNLTHPCISI